MLTCLNNLIYSFVNTGCGAKDYHKGKVNRYTGAEPQWKEDKEGSLYLDTGEKNQRINPGKPTQSGRD